MEGDTTVLTGVVGAGLAAEVVGSGAGLAERALACMNAFRRFFRSGSGGRGDRGNAELRGPGSSIPENINYTPTQYTYMRKLCKIHDV